MKTSVNLLTAVVVAISLVTITHAAPVFSSLKAKNFKEIENCLFKQHARFDSSSFCHRLLNPNHTSADNLTPAEQTLRYVFYTDAYKLWSIYSKWSECRMRTWEDKDECHLRLSDYDGFFLIAFRTDKHKLQNRFNSYLRAMSPFSHKVKHCMHFHASNSSSLLPHYEKCSGMYASLNQDNVLQTFQRLRFSIALDWPKQSAARHGVSLTPSNAHEKAELRDEEAIYSCFYSQKSFNSDDRKEFCRNIVNTKATARASDFSSSAGVSLQGLNRTEKHYIEFVRSNIVYDCLKYHRTERVHWCEDVFKHASCTWAKDGAHHDPIVEMAVKQIKEEEEQTLPKIESVADYFMTPFILPKRLTNLCELYSIAGKKVAVSRPKDCEKGGLYYPFL